MYTIIVFFLSSHVPVQQAQTTQKEPDTPAFVTLPRPITIAQL